jgi:hypothetical protein
LTFSPQADTVYVQQRELYLERAEPEFVNIYEAQESIPSLAGLYDNPIWLTDPSSYIGWRNRFLGSLNVYKFGL